MVSCGNRSQRDKKSYFGLPRIITHQGTKTHELSKKRQAEWLVRIRREDITPNQYVSICVCSDHFVCRVPAKLYDVDNPDWAPSLKLFNKNSESANGNMQRYERIAQ